MKASLVVHGPAGCGKTSHAEELRAHFGLAEVVEADDVRGSLPYRGALILTNEPGQKRLRDHMFMSFEAAMRDMARGPTL